MPHPAPKTEQPFTHSPPPLDVHAIHMPPSPSPVFDTHCLLSDHSHALIQTQENSVEQACNIFYTTQDTLLLTLGEGRGDLRWWKGREKC